MCDACKYINRLCDMTEIRSTNIRGVKNDKSETKRFNKNGC
jgi:hypothetical protein